jgi:hypothetical protein
MRRLGRLLLGVAAVGLLLAVAGIGERRVLGPVLPVALAAAALTWAASRWRQQRRPIIADGWVPTSAIGYRPASGRPSTTPGPVLLSLARVETRELTTSPAFGIGLGFCALATFLFGHVWAGDYGGDLPLAIELGPILTHPLAGMVVVAAFRARTRGRRDGTEELFEACPTSQPTRTGGHLLTAWAPAAVALAYLGVLLTLIATNAVTPYGQLTGRQVAAVAGAALLCVGATALGVALARWLPWTVVPVAAVVGVGFLAADLATRGTRTTEPLRQLSTFLVDPEVDLRLTAPHWLAHHIWILSLVAAMGVVAVARDLRSRVVLAVGTVVLVVAVSSAAVATRPISTGAAQRIAALIEDPSMQPCQDAGGLAVCTYRGDTELAEDLVRAATPVAAAAPAGALTGWGIRQSAGTDRQQLDPEVRALLDPEPRRSHVLPIEFTGHPLALEGLRLWTGLAAVGALDDWWSGSTVGLRGQARGAIALWLATRGAEPGAQLAMTSVGDPLQAGGDTTRPWPDPCFAGPSPAHWAATDVAAARQMLTLPETTVRAALHADWAHLTDRSTSTDDLLRALGLEPIGVHGDTPSTSAC